MFRIATKDKWLALDKVLHLVTSAALFILCLLFFKVWDAVLVTLALGVLWEVKDAIMPYEKYGWWGGDGFSIKDIIFDVAGVAIVFTLFTIFEIRDVIA